MTYDELRKQLVKAASKQNIPISGEFELTSYCNLRCKMCFIREDSKKHNLSTNDWLRIINEAKDSGMLFVLFTGGEIFTRKDFKEIYEATYDLGMRIILFTNGTLINEDIIKILTKRPPDYVAITLYGACNETYEKITGNSNGFDLVIKGIKLLKENNIYVRVRTIAIKEIYQEMDKILNFVDEMDLFIDYSLYVGPRREKCEKTRGFERLNPNELLEYEKYYTNKYNVNLNNEFKYSDNGFNCVAGVSAFFVNFKGEMTPCAMLEYPKLKITDFKETWNKFNKLIKEMPSCKLCNTCLYKNECIQCPARRYLEEGVENCSKYMKEFAKIRYENKRR